MPDRPNKETIFHQACEIKDASERASFIAQACQGDESLRAEIEELLELDDQRDSLLDFELTNLDQTSDSFPILEKPGDEIGPFKLLQKVGEGGMGVVYMAEQKVPVRRRVALKIIKPGMDTREVVARFEAERQALAMMDHPNIAKVLDCGATKTGRPYFVMELVKGVSITQYCDANHLTPKERMELFVPVCQAIQHAHQKGIIHRDVKPSNILIAEYDHTPVPKIIDFGVAKALNQQLTEKTMFTQLGQIIGTIEYMSPEQAKVNQLDVDTRSDIYSLGVLLYELLSGSTPFDKKRMRSVAIDELMRIIREEDPPRPSTRLSTIETLPSIAANRNIEPKKLSTLLHGELDWIVMKAMEKDRGRRYDTASAFADDIQNYLNDEAVLACPPSASYRFRKFARRNKATLVTGGIVATALILGIIGTSWQAVRASQSAERERDAKKMVQESLVAEKVARQDAERARIKEANQREIAVNERQSAERSRDTAETEAIRANTVVDVLTELFASSNSNDEFARPANYTVRELLFNMADRLPERLKDQPEVEAEVRAVIGRALTSFSGFNEISQAADQLKIALKLRREVYGDLHAKTIDSLLDLSDFYWKIGSRTKCKEQSRKAFEMSRQLVNNAPADPNHVNVRLRSMRSSLRPLAWREKFALCEEAIGLARNHSVNDNPHLAEIWGVFAESKWNEHKALHANGPNENKVGMDAVRSIAEKALAENSRIFGQEHPMTAWCLSLLGRLELANANRDGAARYFRKAFEIQKKYDTGATVGSLTALKKVLPDDEFDKLVEQNYLFGGGDYLMYRAIAQFEQGNLREYQRTIARLIENFDEDGFGPWFLANACSLSEHAVKDWSPVIDLIRNSESFSGVSESERLAMLGGVLLRAGKTSEAVETLTHSTKTWKSMRGTLLEDSFVLPDIWAYELMLAIALHAEGNSEEAKQQFIQVANEAPRFLVGKEFNAGGYRIKLVLLLGEAQSLLEISPESFEIEPNNPWSYVARGQLFESAGQTDQAIADFGRAIDLKPDNIHLLNLRADFLRASGKHKLAIAEYSSSIELNPSQGFMSYHHRAECFRILGQNEKAIDDYTRAIELHPAFFWSYLNRGFCHQKMGKFSDAINDYRASLKLDPQEWKRVHIGLIDCYRESKQSDEAIEQLDEIIGLNPNEAEHWHQRGNFLKTMERYQLAVESFSKALEIKPDHTWARFNRGQCFAKLGANDKAIDDYQAIKNLFDVNDQKVANIQLYFELGETLLQLKEFEMASDVLEKAIDLAPGKTHYRKRAALAHFHLGQYKQALADLQVRADDDPDDTSTLVWINPDLVSQCPDEPFKKGLLQLADNLIETTQNKGVALVCRARLHFAMEHITDGQADLTKAIELEPDNASVWDQSGEMYVRLGRLGEASTDFERAIEIEPKSWPPRYHLALAQLGSRDLEGYRATCQAIIEAFAKTEDPQDANFTAWTCSLSA